MAILPFAVAFRPRKLSNGYERDFMNRLNATALVLPAAAALLLAGCSGVGGAPDPVGKGTGPANTAAPGGGEPATAPSEVTIEAPSGGAAVRMGDTEEPIDKVGCIEINDTFAISGSNEGGAKTAVTTSSDRQTVISAQVVFADGKLVDMKEGAGSATISWEGDNFVVSGTGPYLDFNTESQESTQDVGFMVKGSCQA